MAQTLFFPPSCDSEGLEDFSPGDPGLGPSGHGAVQLEGLALPDGLSTGLHNKLWRVCQAVWVHFLTELAPLIHLQPEKNLHASL